MSPRTHPGSKPAPGSQGAQPPPPPAHRCAVSGDVPAGAFPCRDVRQPQGHDHPGHPAPGQPPAPPAPPDCWVRAGTGTTGLPEQRGEGWGGPNPAPLSTKLLLPRAAASLGEGGREQSSRPTSDLAPGKSWDMDGGWGEAPPPPPHHTCGCGIEGTRWNSTHGTHPTPRPQGLSIPLTPRDKHPPLSGNSPRAARLLARAPTQPNDVKRTSFFIIFFFFSKCLFISKYKTFLKQGNVT